MRGMRKIERTPPIEAAEGRKSDFLEIQGIFGSEDGGSWATG